MFKKVLNPLLSRFLFFPIKSKNNTKYDQIYSIREKLILLVVCEGICTTMKDSSNVIQFFSFLLNKDTVFR